MTSLYSFRIACNSATLSTPVLAGGLGGSFSALSKDWGSALEIISDTGSVATGVRWTSLESEKVMRVVKIRISSPFRSLMSNL